MPGFTRLEVGEPVDCGIAIAKEQVILQSQGTVASRTCGRRCEEGPAGIDVELLSSEWRTREMIDELLSGKETVPSRRRHWRYHAEMEAEYSHSGMDVVGEIEDIGLEGAAIRSQHLLDCGARLPLRLMPPDGPPIDVLGEVRWLRKGDAAAFGVQFRFAASPERSRVRDLIDDIEDHMARLSA